MAQEWRFSSSARWSSAVRDAMVRKHFGQIESIDPSLFLATRETGHRAALSRTKYGHFLDVPRADSGSELDTLLRT